MNTTNRNPTHFMAAVKLIEKGREYYHISSENWPSPSEYRFGSPEDRYYAEVWVDGMDWQKTYWLLETSNLEDPIILPLIIFSDHEERDKIEDWDYRKLVLAMLWYRRDKLWMNHDTVYTNWDFWSYIKPVEPEVMNENNMKKYYIEHASCKRAEFWAHSGFIPTYNQETQKYD